MPEGSGKEELVEDEQRLSQRQRPFHPQSRCQELNQDAIYIPKALLATRDAIVR